MSAGFRLSICTVAASHYKTSADEIVERRAAVTTECQRLIARQAAVIREISSVLDRMQTASVTTVDWLRARS
jgi:hypothetical protein